MRIPLAVAFVVFFKPAEYLFHLSIAITILAALTDMADGKLARALGVASVTGRQWDSLGDKAFYIAVIVAFLENGMLFSVLAWGLLVREVALYIMRVLYIDNLPEVERIRPYTNWHGYFMYAVIVLGFLEMHARIQGLESGLYVLIQCFALGALAFGLLSIVKYVTLK